MDSAEEEIYFQKLQEFIQDDDKIVTVSSLASDLGISLQDSRILIGKYVDDHRKLKPNELTVTYVLTGILKDSKGRGVFMVKEDDLKQQRDLFANVPYEVVYSVQKCKHIDFNVIALIDKIDSTRIREKALDGSIVSKNCVKRILKFRKLPTLPPATLKGKSAFFVPKPSKSEDTSKPLEKESPKTEPKNKASAGIASLFKAAAAKTSQKDAEKSSTSKVSKPATKQNGGLAGFLTNGALNSSKSRNNGNVKKETDVKKEAGSLECITVKNEDDADVIDVNLEDKPGKLVKHGESKVKKKPESQDKQNKNKRLRDKSQETPAKKRKRIVERNDSDSDDLFEKEEDNEDIVEKSDDEPERVPSPVKKEFVPKNKRRKAVTRNYEDEEGFIVTQTEYIYETASEDDENEEPKRPKPEKQAEKPKPKAAEKKKVAKSHGSLMNFFYKK